jgi:hypothetical protein
VRTAMNLALFDFDHTITFGDTFAVAARERRVK